MRDQLSPALRGALAGTREDHLYFDLSGIEDRYRTLTAELPGVQVRFAMKSCPVDGVLRRLAALGSGFDAAGPQEIAGALRTGVPADRIHYGNTVKSDSDIARAHRLGIRMFATDSVEDVAAIAAHAPGSRVFCRLATSGEGALWGLSRKFGCPPGDAVRIMLAAREHGLDPVGLSVHVGSQQMRPEAWREAGEAIAAVIADVQAHGLRPDFVNLGGGLPATGYVDRHGQVLDPPMDKIYAVIRETMQTIGASSSAPPAFVIEPGRHLVADHGAIRAHIVRLASRRHPGGGRQYWLYLSCGKFNGMYEMDQLQYRLVFPGRAGGATVPAVIAGPTCDSDDAYAPGGALVQVPKSLASGDPVWILSSGAYAVSYTTQGFNGFRPLPHSCLEGSRR